MVSQVLQRAPALTDGGRAELRFDGVYMNSDVWLNGHHLGHHPYGYTGFAYDLTPYLSPENVLAVRVNNIGRNSRWYSGSGIYRHVWLTITDDLYIPMWGVGIEAEVASVDTANLVVSIPIENGASKAREVNISVRIFSPGGTPVGTWHVQTNVPSEGRAHARLSPTISSPQLWSTSTPDVYRAEVHIRALDGSSDSVSTNFGIRTIEVDAERGLRMNGKPVKLRGGCMHHDNGVLGSAAFDRAEERRVELMKANGFNAIRCSHNPPSPFFLDVCDRLGMLVLDEAFDMWEKPKNPNDYHLDFQEWWKRDLDTMILRDRNHPSVIMWSIGNEISERADPSGVAIAEQLAKRIRELDRTRPITSAVPPLF